MAHLIERPSVVALAGRRIDPVGANVQRFPLSAVPKVRAALRSLLVTESPHNLVCSAACGTDLIGLVLARQLHIPAHIVLPFAEDEFRRTSVTDRPGDWGETFDLAVDRARRMGTLTVLSDAGRGDAAYGAVTRQIIAIARDLADGAPVIAVTVTDQQPRDTHDATAEFRELAANNGFRIIQVDI